MLAIDHLTYDDVISNVAKAIEAIGAVIMVVGGLWAFLSFGVQTLHPESRSGAYQRLRRQLGQVILIGLEVLIVGDIVRTIIVDPRSAV